MKRKAFMANILARFLMLGLLAGIGSMLAGTGEPGRAAEMGSSGSRSGGFAEVIWSDLPESAVMAQGERWIQPAAYRLLSVSIDELRKSLAAAPAEESAAVESVGAVLVLPLPDGSDLTFRLVQSPVLSPALAIKFPLITTYAGRGLDDPRLTARLDWTPAGFHAIIFTPQGTVYIDPYQRGDVSHYISYYKSDFIVQPGRILEESGPLGETAELEAALEKLRAAGVQSGSELRIYRVAIAATGEYTQFHGGTVGDGMAAIATALNRVNGIYEREVAVRMVLVDNNNLVVYTNPVTDPYTNNNGSAMLEENQITLDAVIGNSNYDIGHVFSTGGGGVAYLGVPCRTGMKAKGVTGLPLPTGDPFYVDYVAHEMGHQFDANHTFNGNAGACSGANRNAETAYEPGSASTIMGYAGICANQNLQPNSDDYFHTISFDEIVAYTTVGAGNSCPQVIATGNSAPSVDAGLSGLTLPILTPFWLVGSGEDPDGDPLTFVWEEFDLGPAGHPDSPAGNAPIFRSFSPVDSPDRFFPKITDILSGTHTIGELLPTYSRDLTFRLTARDNQVSPSAGGVAYDLAAFSVTDQAGPFRLTQPNSRVTWQGGSQQEIRWDVANTNLPPVTCTSVDIRLSIDSGYTYPVLVLNGTPNDGSQLVMVPNISANQARWMVACSSNVFFDISDVGMRIVEDFALTNLSLIKSVIPSTALEPGEPLTYTITVSNTGHVTATTTITDEFPVGLSSLLCDGEPGNLYTSTLVAPGQELSFACSAVVDPALGFQMALNSDRAQVLAGQALTYTIAVTNSHQALSLHDVTITASNIPGCAIGEVLDVELAPQESAEYICPGVITDEPFTAMVSLVSTANIINIAHAAAPEDPSSPLESNPTETRVELDVAATTQVDVLYPLYLPLVERATSAGRHPQGARLAGATSALFVLFGSRLAQVVRRKQVDRRG